MMDRWRCIVMKDRYSLLKDIQQSLGAFVDKYLLEIIIDNITMVLYDYEVTDRCTDLAVCGDENQKLLQRYAACLYVEGKSEKPIKGYIYRLNDMLKVMNINFKEAGAYDIRFYMGLLKQKGNSSSTIESVRCYISAFYKWMHLEGIIDKNPCEVLKPISYNTRIRHPFSDLEIERIRNSCKNVRERAIVETLLSTGIRVSELQDLNIEDIDFDHKVVHIQHGKGDKSRDTFINSIAVYHLKKYLDSRDDNNPELFRSKTGRLHPGGVRFILKEIESRCGVPDIHPHRFRHTFATVLNSKGMPIQHIQQLLGHSRIDTTLVYVSIDKSEIQHEYSRMLGA